MRAASRRRPSVLIRRRGTADRLSDFVGFLLPSTYLAWRRADRAAKQRIVDEPLLFLRALASTTTDPDESPSLHKDLTTLAAIAWRAGRRVRDGERFTAELTRAWRAASDAFATLGHTIEEKHAGPDHPTDDPETA